ncbi:putative Pal1 cell morphology protein [Rosellinia necatrix]|uniref:Putative Pal1 cell morphology protein n=1 Tax=Rosellinia necatrix TaxID=77044 RepID=A0A1W2TWF4_ROSNE|nr:putative Pal1 cell morphology protein [Rosellinia necatrix]
MEGDLLGLGQPSGQLTTNGPPSGLTLNLSSNNPFRNRAASPNNLASPPLRSPFEDPPPRPTSRNPFLDPAFSSSSSQLVTSPEKMAQAKSASSPTAEELFDSLDINDKTSKKPQSRPNGGPSTTSRPSRGPPRGENIPPQGRSLPSSSHRPTRSQEEALKARRMQAGPSGSKPKGGSPQRQPEPRLRRNSESSIMEKPITDEERKAREMRQRDRERRHRDGKSRPKKLDIIDQLDATSIYGTGLFHHDGPFDACNPHRNRKGSRRAPMQAFAKDSANNTIGGAGPLNKRPDHALFMGHDPHDASSMYASGRDPSKSKSHEMELFDPKQRAEFEHGEETLGLGSSTFLEGTPAARTAIARNQEETAQEAAESGLGRKKSVVQRFKSIKRGPRDYKDYTDLGRVTSPDYYHGHSPRPSLPSANTGERNPFFADYDKGEEQISVKRKDSDAMSPLSPPPPHGANLERRATTDATMDSPVEGQMKQANAGFLSRVKSLKGGRRQRPEPPVKDGAPAQTAGNGV